MLQKKLVEASADGGDVTRCERAGACPNKALLSADKMRPTSLSIASFVGEASEQKMELDVRAFVPSPALLIAFFLLSCICFLTLTVIVYFAGRKCHSFFCNLGRSSVKIHILHEGNK